MSTVSALRSKHSNAAPSEFMKQQKTFLQAFQIVGHFPSGNLGLMRFEAPFKYDDHNHLIPDCKIEKLAIDTLQNSVYRDYVDVHSITISGHIVHIAGSCQESLSYPKVLQEVIELQQQPPHTEKNKPD